ncbi:MAG: hypothetical protein ACE5ID_10465, partial [Acidobacteriota bacterium]
LDGPVVCRSSDDDNITAAGGVECILDDDNDGTSFAAAAVTGAAALVRDYFAQGFADDGSPGGPEVGRNLSGAAVKAVLLASAQFMRVSPGFNFDLSTPRFDVPDLSGRFNFEQGYGRVNLSKILPLATDAQSPTGLLLEDQGLAGGLVTGGSFSRTLTVLDPTQELRIALVWMDPPDLSGSGRLINDLDLEVTDHGPDNILGTADDVLYRGNFFTEDQGSFDGFLLLSDPNFPLIPGEDSDGDGILDESAFSLPVFTSIRNFHDRDNPNEAVFLSPDPNHDGNPADSQLAAGQKITVQVDAHQVTSPFETVVSAGGNGVLETTPSGDDLQGPGPTINAGADGVADSAAAGDDIQVVAVGQTAPQPFALVMGGGFVQTSSLRMNASRYLCNDLVQVILLDPTPGLQLADVAAAVSLKVMAPGGAILDSENSFSFSEPQPGSGRFVSLEEPVIDGVAAVPDDSILSVVDGAELVAQYTDADGPVVTFKASVSCQPDIGLAKVSRPGTNLSYSVRGGCDTPPRRDPRGILSGFPPRPSGDLFLDAGEILDYKVAVLNREEQADLIDAVATLRAVFPDGDNASDPARLNNLPADNGPGRKVRILQPTRDVGLIPRGSLQAISFGIVVQPNVSFPEQIEMVFGLSAKRNGLSTEFTSVFLHTLNMDEESFAYSTDFPTGGMETRVNAGEFLNLGPGLEPQTFVFQDATTTAFGGGNPQWASTAPEPKAPWTFDLNDEGFTT